MARLQRIEYEGALYHVTARDGTGPAAASCRRESRRSMRRSSKRRRLPGSVSARKISVPGSARCTSTCSQAKAGVRMSPFTGRPRLHHRFCRSHGQRPLDDHRRQTHCICGRRAAQLRQRPAARRELPARPDGSMGRGRGPAIRRADRYGPCGHHRHVLRLFHRPLGGGSRPAIQSGDRDVRRTAVTHEFDGALAADAGHGGPDSRHLGKRAHSRQSCEAGVESQR